MAEFYVYVHRRADNGMPFYVGKGKGSRLRVLQQRNAYWKNVVAKAGGYSASVALPGLDEELAHLAEIELIAKYRAIGVRLTNLTDGGEGMSGFKASRDSVERRAAKLRGVPKSPEHRARLSASKKGKKATLAARKQMSEARKGRPSGMLGKFHSEESKRKTSEALKGAKNPFFGKKPTPEVVELIRAANLGRRDSDETRRRKSIAREGEKNPRFGVNIPEEQKLRQIAALKVRPRLSCPNCNRAMDEANAKRWHFANCKERN